MILLIAAVNHLNVIGRDGKLPWHCPEDLKFFHKITMGCPIIMGRKTYESLPVFNGVTGLEGRLHIVVSKTNPKKDLSTKIFVDSIEDAITIGKNKSSLIFIIGGSQIYSYVLRHKIADFCIVNVIDDNTLGDTFFPSYLLNSHYRERSLNRDLINELVRDTRISEIEMSSQGTKTTDDRIRSLSHLLQTGETFKTAFYERA